MKAKCLVRVWNLSTVLFLVFVPSPATAQHRQPPPPPAAESAGKYVAAFLDQFSEVKCTERVTQAKLTPGGKVEYSEDSTFDYLVIMQGGDNDLLLSESRLVQQEARHSKMLPLLVTNGFSTLFLVLHPYYRDSFTFTEAGDELIQGTRFARVRFDHILGTRTPMALTVRGREYPLQLTGTAWINPVTGSIAQIDASLAVSMQDVGLKRFSTRVQYSPLVLTGVDQAYRFPTLATVEVETLRQQWRNTHRFSEYKRFSVTTDKVLAETK